MPNRILREGILTSEPVNGLTPQAELFYRRLMSVVDDYGRYFSSLKLLRTACYPLQVDRVREADISRWIAECKTAGLLVLYACDETGYLQVLKVDAPRAKYSKYPALGDLHLSARICAHLRPIAISNSIAISDSKTPQPPKGGERGVAADKQPPEGFARFWAEWPKHVRRKGRSKCLRLWVSRNLESLADVIVESVRQHKQCEDWTKERGKYIPGPHPWLNDEAWEASLGVAADQAAASENGFVRAPFTRELADAAGLPWSEEVERIASGGPK